MPDRVNVQTHQALPYGATEIHLDLEEFSDALAVRLAESGASDEAIDAAGGPGTADRMHGADVGARRESAHAVASSDA